jgi:hypothetical protein
MPDTGASLATGRVVDLFLYDSTTKPLPYTGFEAPHDQEDCFGFQADTVLTLLIKGTV